MTLTLTPAPADTHAPAARAATNFARNCAALGTTLAIPDADFGLARDGSLTARRDGQWLGGCSVPRRAAEVMLHTARWPGPTVCLVLPTHGQQIAVCFDRLGPPHGLIVLMASTTALTNALACCDFSEAIRAGRLFFATDLSALEALFDAHPGLAVPQQLVRLPDADPAAISETTKAAQAIMARRTADHVGRVKDAAKSAASPAGWCVVAPQHLRLWNDAGYALGRTAGGPADVVHDADHPTTAAEAALAEAAAGSEVVVTADRPRPAWARRDRPWVTWVTRGRVPAFEPLAPRDALLLADAAWRPAARTAGWPDDRIAVAGWPVDPVTPTPGAQLALIYDLPALDPPAEVTEFSGRQVVWEAIREELTQSPFALGDDARAYIDRGPGRLKMTRPDDFPTDLFLTRLVAPAFALGLARWLVREKVPLALHGHGWADHADLAPHARGPVTDRETLRAAVVSSSGLVDPTVSAVTGALDAFRAPVLRCLGRTPPRVLQDAAAIKTGRLPVPPSTTSLSRNVIKMLLR